MQRAKSSGQATVKLPVLPGHGQPLRQSKTSKWRAMSLILVHLIMIAHGLQWLIAGTTLSPVEPSESMYTLNDGHLNAGFIFFVLALILTLVLGRFVCGWGCHFIAYQDLCAWFLKKLRIKPKPFRARLLVFAPLALAIYMFVWPTAYRLWFQLPAPKMANHLVTTEFWKTFPGFWVAALTVAVAGFAIVYFLGSKGFCTYACPYGGFFGVVDRFALGRIRVNDNCEHCGHCTATCTSNVRVHEEVARYGMVVDPGCMKCMDCVSVCPNDALSFGFSKLTTGKTDAASAKQRKYDLTLAEELLAVAVGIASLLAFRGLYNQIPLLLAMGMAAITAFVAAKAFRLIRSPNVRLQNLQFKRGGKLTGAGVGFATFAALLCAFTVHSGFIQFATWQGRRATRALALPDSVWSPGDTWWASASDESRAEVDSLVASLERVDRIGLGRTPTALEELIWLYLAKGNAAAAENAARTLCDENPDQPGYFRGLANVLKKQERYDEAEAQYRKSLALDPSYTVARLELARMLQTRGRADDAVTLLREAVAQFPNDDRWPLHLSELLLSLGKTNEAKAEIERVLSRNPDSVDALNAKGVMQSRSGSIAEAIQSWSRAVELDPTRTDIRYNLATTLINAGRVDEAIDHLRRIVEANPDSVPPRFNLAVALYARGNRSEALEHARRAAALAPDNQQISSFLEMLESGEQSP